MAGWDRGPEYGGPTPRWWLIPLGIVAFALLIAAVGLLHR